METPVAEPTLQPVRPNAPEESSEVANMDGYDFWQMLLEARIV